ncbi:MAG TPA: aminomethyltransferase family protein, partial [Polyangiaceae bacterium]
KGQSIAETGTTTARPFFHPVALSHLAGRGFHPERKTSLHHLHDQRGARYLLAGDWLRPAYYPKQGRSREELIAAEALAVRTTGGLIDLGTLGKISIMGRDAVDFIERVYTGKFATLKVGMSRYALMCDESGVIIDDGVVVRRAEDRFYVTTTTTASSGIFAELQRWALLWGKHVVLSNETGHRGAINLAGPLSRQVLAPLTDIDLSEKRFPYLAAREGHVLGVPVMAVRVGFVGELGYEIHMPIASAARIWTGILEAGAALGIEPFGVEAQRVLRLEKGHAIISQDTDGLTTPREAAMTWAVKDDKPFFVGQRSLRILSKKAIDRTLVGFTMAAEGPIPKECHLVIDGDRIVGRVTSVVRSPTLNQVIGLAYVHPSQSSPGTVIRIRIDGGALVEGRVSTLPFYDPENSRQKAGAPDRSAAA